MFYYIAIFPKKKEQVTKSRMFCLLGSQLMFNLIAGHISWYSI